MITYSLIWMGPINANWIKQHGNNWAMGRIEVRSGQLDWSDQEYGICVDSKDWETLDDFLSRLKTETMLTKDQLCAMFESKTGNKLVHKQW